LSGCRFAPAPNLLFSPPPFLLFLFAEATCRSVLLATSLAVSVLYSPKHHSFQLCPDGSRHTSSKRPFFRQICPLLSKGQGFRFPIYCAIVVHFSTPASSTPPPFYAPGLRTRHPPPCDRSKIVPRVLLSLLPPVGCLMKELHAALLRPSTSPLQLSPCSFLGRPPPHKPTMSRCAAASPSHLTVVQVLLPFPPFFFLFF